MFRVKFWGVRGSIPSPGPNTVRFGGNTSCVEVNCGDNLIILDGGTGLRALGESIVKKSPLKAYMFFSHVHWDHIQGFPFFTPTFIPQNSIEIYGGKSLSATLAETLAGQMNFPNFPITLEQMAASISFNLFDDGKAVKIGTDIIVKALFLNHPNGCYGYRIEYDGKTIAYCTDTEHSSESDKHVVELAKNADLFIYDSQFTPEEYEGKNGTMSKKGWGHSTFAEGASLAKLAEAKHLILFHHDPNHDDNTIIEIEKRCRKLFPKSDAAYEGLVYEL